MYFYNDNITQVLGDPKETARARPTCLKTFFQFFLAISFIREVWWKVLRNLLNGDISQDDVEDCKERDRHSDKDDCFVPKPVERSTHRLCHFKFSIRLKSERIFRTYCQEEVRFGNFVGLKIGRNLHKMFWTLFLYNLTTSSHSCERIKLTFS